MANQPVRIGQARQNIRAFKPRVSRKDRFDVVPGRQHAQHILHRKPPPPDNRLAAEDFRVYCDALRPGGRFVTYTYLQSPLLAGGKRFRKKLHERFSEVGETRMVWLNLPPAFVYWGVK